MTDQLYMNQDGELEAEPVTWDGEPLFSRSTVQEGLFCTDAFEQLAGQTSMPEIDNSPEAVEMRRCMFQGFGWGVL